MDLLQSQVERRMAAHEDERISRLEGKKEGFSATAVSNLTPVVLSPSPSTVHDRVATPCLTPAARACLVHAGAEKLDDSTPARPERMLFDFKDPAPDAEPAFAGDSGVAPFRNREKESSRNDEMELIQEADRSKWIAHSNHNIKRFIKGDIERMTNNYRTILGRGAFGEVYKGVLDDKSMVAVKKLMGTVEEKFAKELIVHREINHKNVVRLIGYCAEENALMLVMEYISNGNLSDLHDDNRSIPLDIRLRIAIECAEALAYMHSHMYTQVIHGDIKPENLLLDSNFHAKLSDFGISRLANTDKTLRTENVIGSIGYMDPLLSMDGRLTVKSDVYSFGVVLIELITKRKALVDNVNNVYAFTDALTRGIGGVREMFDVDIASKKNMKVLEGVAKLAGECLRMNRDKRPEMIAVAECLRVLQKSSYQDKGRQRVDLLSWVRKSIPTPPALVNTRANILMRRQFSLAEMKSATNNFDKSATKMRDVLLDLEHALQLQENGEEGGSMSHDFMELQENGEEGDSMSESDDSMRTIVFLDSMDSNDLAPSVA